MTQHHSHHHHHHHHHHHNEKTLGWTILLNIIITVAELVGGLLSGSLALLSDAAHNASDVLSLITSWFGEKVSKKKASKTYSFGFKRVEIFTALINALSLCGIAAWIMVEAVERLQSPGILSLHIMIPVATVGLLGNAVSIFLLNPIKNDTLNMKAAYLHLFYDTISSVLVIISGIIIAFTNLVILDLIMSVVISIFMIVSALGIIKESCHILLQGVPETISFDDVSKTICEVEGVDHIHDLHIWAMDSSHVYLSCHVTMTKEKKENNEVKNNKENKKRSDALIQAINQRLYDEFKIAHTTLQLENDLLCDASTLCSS